MFNKPRPQLSLAWNVRLCVLWCQRVDLGLQNLYPASQKVTLQVSTCARAQCGPTSSAPPCKDDLGKGCQMEMWHLTEQKEVQGERQV